MTKQKLQLTIALIALIGALATAASWKVSNAADGDGQCKLPTKPPAGEWKQFRESNDDGQFAADWIAANLKCRGDKGCIDKELFGSGWHESSSHDSN